jgi:hypothetical protein
MKQYRYFLIVNGIFLVLLTQACGIVRYNVQGQIVDAATKKPIKDAAVVIHWYNYDILQFPPGMNSGYDDIGTFETLSDGEGYFEVPKYVFQMCKMGVYKSGYIGWYSEFIFPKEYKKVWDERNGFKVESNMLIQLESKESLVAKEPYTIEYVRSRHACFVDSIPTYCKISGYESFNKAIKEESNTCGEYEGRLK